MLAACGTPYPSAGPTPSPQGEDEIASALTHSGLCWAGQIVFHLLSIEQSIQKCMRRKIVQIAFKLLTLHSILHQIHICYPYSIPKFFICQ